ncbi:NgoFVII family restriction endonuclease [Microbacterium esteraromaticum]|nr:NgoFVII family restriction endonuclease [Microbacterium esteraromaticum]
MVNVSKDSLLLTSISPLLTEKDQVTIVDCFYEQLDKSNALDILVGYCSKASLEKLDTLIFQKGLKNICLILGMYYFEGFPKTLYELVIELNKK